MSFKDNFNKNFWRFLTGFLIVLIVSLFSVIIAGTLAGDIETQTDEECIFFC